MGKVEIKFVKTHPDAVLPKCNHTGKAIGDTGYDLVCVENTIIPARNSAIVPIGIKVGYITPGYWFKVESRSGLSFKHSLLSHPGIVDNQYRGDMGVKVYNHSDKDYEFKKGDKIAQLVVYELIQPEISWIEEAVESERGEKGFGSSDELNISFINEKLKGKYLLSPVIIDNTSLNRYCKVIKRNEESQFVNTNIKVSASILSQLEKLHGISVEEFIKTFEAIILEENKQ